MMVETCSNGAGLKAESAFPSDLERPVRWVRLARHKTIRLALDQGRKMVCAAMVLYYRPNDGVECRWAIRTRKALGGAVCRNRLRRLFREAIRQQAHILQPIDAVILPRHEAMHMNFHQVSAAVSQTFLKIVTAT